MRLRGRGGWKTLCPVQRGWVRGWRWPSAVAKKLLCSRLYPHQMTKPAPHPPSPPLPAHRPLPQSHPPPQVLRQDVIVGAAQRADREGGVGAAAHGVGAPARDPGLEGRRDANAPRLKQRAQRAHDSRGGHRGGQRLVLSCGGTCGGGIWSGDLRRENRAGVEGYRATSGSA